MRYNATLLELCYETWYEIREIREIRKDDAGPPAVREAGVDAYSDEREADGGLPAKISMKTPLGPGCDGRRRGDR